MTGTAALRSARAFALAILMVLAGCRDQAAYDSVVARHRPVLEGWLAKVQSLPAPNVKQIRDGKEEAKPALAEPLELPTPPSVLADNKFAAPTRRNYLVRTHEELKNVRLGSNCAELLDKNSRDRDRWYKSRPEYWDGLLTECFVRYVVVVAWDVDGHSAEYGKSGAIVGSSALSLDGVFEVWDLKTGARIHGAPFRADAPDAMDKAKLLEVQQGIMLAAAERALLRLSPVDNNGAGSSTH